MIIIGDALTELKRLESGSVNCCVTSPPYWGLRDYGHPGQLGLEKTPGEYIEKMLDVFGEVSRVLRDDGTLWLNLGDSYAGSWGAQSRANGNYRKSTLEGSGMLEARHIAAYPDKAITGSTKNVPGLKPKDLVGIPWKMAFALQEEGWYLRQDIIWHKPNPMPESVMDRCTKSHEYIFLLSKSGKINLWRHQKTGQWAYKKPIPDYGRLGHETDRDLWRGYNYYFDHEAIKEPQSENERTRRLREQSNGLDTVYKIAHIGNTGQQPPAKNSCIYSTKSRQKLAINGTRNKRSVWTVSTRPYKEAHYATFPPELITPCILAGCPENGIVLDPFFGSGTVGEVCINSNRDFIGIELNPKNEPLIEKRCNPNQIRF